MPRRCANPIPDLLVNRDYFLRYQDENGQAAYADGGRAFCITSQSFTIIDQVLCPNGGQKLGFAQETAANGALLFELLAGD